MCQECLAKLGTQLVTEVKNAETWATESGIRLHCSPGKRGSGWEEPECKEKVRVVHLSTPESLKHEITAIKCHCGAGTPAGTMHVDPDLGMSLEACGQAGQLWVMVSPLESHSPGFLEERPKTSGFTRLSLSFLLSLCKMGHITHTSWSCWEHSLSACIQLHGTV